MQHSSLTGSIADAASAASAGRVAARIREAMTDVAAGDDRAEALWKTAPWLAALSVASALVVLWALRSSVNILLLAGWAGLVVAVAIVAVRARRRAAAFGPSSIIRSAHWSVFEAGMQAAVWASLPALAFAGQTGPVQVLLAAATGTMIAGGFLLAVVPLAAIIWAIMIGGALIWGIHETGGGAMTAVGFLMAAYLAAIVIGCLTVERLLSRHMVSARDERVRREAIGLLLREYEEKGAGWLWEIDAGNLFTYASPHIAHLLGRPAGWPIGQSMPVLFGCDPRLGRQLLERESFARLELQLATPHGPRWISLAGNPLVGSHGDFKGFRGIGSDVTEARRDQDRLTHMASIDMLTGLPNRQKMRELFAEAIERADRAHAACAVLFLDLDGFKPVNDTFGHSIGDAVLRAAAQRLAAAIGDRGQVARVGGDEFAIVLYDTNRLGAEELGRALIRAVSEPCPFDGIEVRVGISIGCAFAPIDGITVDELLLKADLALYQAKSKGRGTFIHFDPGMQREAEARIRLEHDLRQALVRGQFRLHYQPIVSARTQDVVGFEALLRWQHPERGLVSPAQFIPMAEETGFIGELGEWVIKTACLDAAQWPDPVFVSVNLSPRQLVMAALPNTVREALAASRIQPGRLELEVTESVFMSDTDGSLDVLRRIRALGVGIALDDFGTGYSSLGYLNRTVFHTLKIDGSFVRDAARKSETIAVIRAIVALADSFKMAVTAEGIETTSDFERMRALGCHKLQGYLFGRPVPFDETLALVGPIWGHGRKRA